MNKLINLSRTLAHQFSHISKPSSISQSIDPFNSLHLKLNSHIDLNSFTSYLDQVVHQQIQNNLTADKQTNAIWIFLNSQNFGLVSAINLRGFKIFHGLDNKLVFYKWITNKKDLIPLYSPNNISCGAILLKDDKIFLLKQKNGTRKGNYGIPGGRTDFGQSISVCCQRELLEETKIRAKFSYVLYFRELDGGPFGEMDTYFACVMDYDESSLKEIVLDEREVQNHKWVHLSEYEKFSKQNSMGTQYILAKYISSLYKNGYDFKKKPHQHAKGVLTLKRDRAPRNFFQYGMVQGNKIGDLL